MTGGALLAIFLGGVALAFVLAPLLRRGATREESRSESLSELRELHARQQMLLASLKDLEDDRLTNKIDDADYEQLKQRLTAEAIEVMRRLDVVESRHEQAKERERQASRPLPYPGGRKASRPS